MANRNSINTTVHRVNQLLSATKVNRNYIRKNSDHISKIERFLSSMQQVVIHNFKITSDSLRLMDFKLKMEHTLVSLEQSVHHIISHFNRRRRRRQMNSTHHHLLTEDLLPPSQLQKILQQARSLRFATMPQAWYYENCRVSPVWTSLEDIMFRVTLPLHDGKNYILYSLKSFPFPIKPGFNSLLEVENQVAYSSSSGLLFRPILCLDTTVRVCRGGPLYDSERFKCERALISRDSAATQNCKIKITPSNQTIISENSPGLYIISTPAITPKLHCDALGEETVKLTAGVYLLSLNYTCTLRGVDWTLPGLNKFLTPFHIKNQHAPISLRTVFAPFSPQHLQQLSETPHWTPIKKLPSLVLDPLPAPAEIWTRHTLGTVTWINSSGIIIIITISVLVFIGFKCCRQYQPFPRFLRRKPPSAPVETELQPRQPPPLNDQAQTLRLPLYPVLDHERTQEL